MRTLKGIPKPNDKLIESAEEYLTDESQDELSSEEEMEDGGEGEEESEDNEDNEDNVIQQGNCFSKLD
jgi:hypothetical protein